MGLDELIRKIILPLFMAVSLKSYSQEDRKPNIIFFFVDDMGWQDTSVPFYKEVTKLNETYHTPNMERLAQEGLKFTQAYATAVCSPSRISLMTGMNAARHQVTNWTLRKNKSPDPVNKQIAAPEWNLNGLCPDSSVSQTIQASTLPQLLRDAGYRTIHVGKAHFGAKGTPGEEPLHLGFDVNIAGHAAGGPGSYYGTYNFSAKWRNGDAIWDIPGLEKYHGQDVYLTEDLTVEANKQIDKAVAENKPFYLYMSHYAIHAPWEKDGRYYKKYIDQGLSEFNAAYASMIEGMDKSLGDILDNVNKLGIAENTLIVFMSDNGQPKQAELNWPLRGHKLTPYEGGSRVPFIASWPGEIKHGTNTNDYIIIEDVFPTFLEVAGVEYKDKLIQKIDAESFKPLLLGKNPRNRNRSVFWHFPHTYDHLPYSAVRKGDWKLIYHHLDQHFELFDLANDISEKENLAGQDHARVKKLAKILAEFLRTTEAGMPTLSKTGNPVPYPDDVIN